MCIRILHIAAYPLCPELALTRGLKEVTDAELVVNAFVQMLIVLSDCRTVRRRLRSKMDSLLADHVAGYEYDSRSEGYGSTSPEC